MSHVAHHSVHSDEATSLGRRITGRAIDLAIVGVPLLVLAIATLEKRNTRQSRLSRVLRLNGMPTWVRIVVLVVLVGYELVFALLRRPTIGKQIVHSEVVRKEDGGPVGFVRTTLRMLVPFIGVLVAITVTRGGALIILADAAFAVPSTRRRTLHDRLASTVVVDS